jgi:WD40 repeat protein
LAPSKTTDSLTATGAGPVPPPRRKKQRKVSSSSSEHFVGANETLKPQPPEKSGDLLIVVPPTTSSTSQPTLSTDQLLKSDKILPSPGTLLAITKEIENSFSEASTSQTDSKMSRTSSQKDTSARNFSGSMKQISLDEKLERKESPTSVKSNSAPGRVSSSAPIDPNQGLNIYKATQGKYVVKPEDDVFNKAEGPQFEEYEQATPEDIDRINKIRSEVIENTIINDRFKFSAVGSSSLGSSSKYNSTSRESKDQRRKSAGDEDFLKQLNVYVRTRTDSGKPLTDQEILDQVPVKNLDTGETMPLSSADEKLPQCINPLSLHIMRLTSHIPESDEESVGPAPGSEAPPEEEEEDNETESTGRLKRKTARIKKFFSSTAKKAANTAKTFAQEVSHARHKEDVADIEDVVNPEQNIKIKASKTNTGPYDFTKLQHVQDLSGEHQGAVWCMKFSSCGRLLATAGQDKVLRIWVLKDAFQFFQDMRTKYNAEKSSPTPSQESLVSHHSFDEQILAAEKSNGPFMPKSFCSYTGHTSDLLDVSWSKNYFILSSSMDKTVRLWHISRRECLCCFQHIDFVTAICFHPRDDRYFLSGSLDGKLRLWNIPDKKVALWNEVDGQTKLITAANFCQNGKFAVVGSYDGRCLFYNTDQLKYHTQIHVRSTRGKNATGRKISGIEPMPGEDKILITSNDSRIRLYDLRDLNLSCKYKGYMNVSSQIKASFSHDGKYIISGSENQCIYIWKTHHDYAKLSSVSLPIIRQFSMDF